jgi:hypothetical protein
MPAQKFDTKISLGLITSATLDGSITGITVEELNDLGEYETTNNIMRTDRDWQITLKWRLFGSLLDLTASMGPITAELHGNFLVNAYFEGIGQNADEKDLPGDTTKTLGGISLMDGVKKVALTGERTKADPTANPPVEADPEATEWQYEETFTIKGENPNSAPKIERFLKPGAYKLSVNLTYQQPKIDPTTGKQATDVQGNLLFKPGPMAGFMELPDSIQVYDPGTYDVP